MTGTRCIWPPNCSQAGQRTRTDIYALGVLMFHLVTGSFPVMGRSLADLGAAHRTGTRTRLRDLRADLPAPFVRAVETAVAADPADRFQTAGALEAALERAVATAARRCPHARSAGCWSRRSRLPLHRGRGHLGTQTRYR